MATVVTAEETLNAILERYPSGSAALGERLHYFAQHAHKVKDPTTDAAVRKAYRLLSETCKRQGNVVLYKLVFGGNNKNSAPEDASMNMESGDASGGGNNNNAETTASSSMSISSPSPQQDPSLTVDTGVPYDATWVSDQERSHRSHRDALEHRLQVAQSQLHKESLRSAYLALAHHAGGDFTSRIHALLRAKDYCTHKAQTISVCLQIVAAALALHNTTTAVEYIHKLQHTLRTTPSSTSSGNNNKASSSSQTVTQVDQILVNTAAALERMSHGDFGGALPYWLQVVQHEELETAFNSEQVAQLPYWVSVQDVSLYAALCCLTHGRADQRTALADHVTALEYVPHLQQCLTDFTHARYQAAWHCVAVTHTVRLQTDPRVGPYYDMWARVLCRKSLQHYWRAYTQVPLSVMAKDLGPSLVPSLDVLRQEWMDMILEQQQPHNSGGETKDNHDTEETLDLADTRLNLANDTLCRDAPTHGTLAAEQLAKLTQQVLDDSYAMTIRLSCQEYDLCIANPMARKNDGDWRRPQAPLRRPGRGADYSGGGRVDPVLMNDDDEEDDDYVAMQSDEDAAAPAAAAEDTTMVDASAMNPEDLY